MKTFFIEIKETLSLTVEVKARNEAEALEKARTGYMCGDYILDSENFVGVEFEVMAGGEGDRKGEKDNVEKRCA